VVRRRARIGAQRYTSETTYYVADPPTETGKPVADIEQDWPLVEALLSPPIGYNPAVLRQQRAELGEAGAFGVSVGYPGFQNWLGLFQGSLADLATWYYEKHDYIERLRDLTERQALTCMAMILDGERLLETETFRDAYIPGVVREFI